MPVYAEYQPRRSWRERWAVGHLSDVLPWRAVVAPGVVLQKNGHSLQRTYAMRGPDVMGETPEVQGALMLQANEVLKRLGGQWMLQAEAQRQRVTTLPPIEWQYPVAALLERQQRQRLLEQPGSRETVYYLTLTWSPPPVALQQGVRWLMTGPGRVGSATDQEVSVRDFVEHADYLMDLLKGMLAVCRPLTTAETLTYLHSCVSDTWHSVGHLASLMDIDVQLCDTPWVGGWYPQLGDWHVRTCSVIGYPAESVVGIVRTLDAADLDYRWSTRWVGMEKHYQTNMLKKQQWAWVGQERTFVQRAGESISHEKSRVIDSDATNKAMDVDAARQEIGMDIIAYGNFTSTVTVWDPDTEEAERKRRLVMQAFQSQGFTVRAETEHATAAWLSSHPGNRRDNVRRTPQHSLTLAHLCPGLTAAWPGPHEDAYLQGGPWLYAPTEQSTLFRIVNHVRDLGHFLVLGSTRSGKSTLGNILRAQWLQYAGAQAKLFDLDKSGRLLTYLLGGRWYDLGSPTLRLQPLRHCDDPQHFGLILQWLLDLVEEFRVPLTAPVSAYLGANLRKLARLAPARRTLSQLVTLMAEGSRDTELKANAGRTDAQGIAHPDTDLKALVVLQTTIRGVLKRFTDGGEYGGIFDGTEDAFDANPVQTFEMRGLVQRPQLLGSVMRYVTMALEQQMRTDQPMLLLLDDAAVTWLVPPEQQAGGRGGDEAMQKLEQRCRDWLMTTAKKSVSLGFMTHSLTQVFASRLGPLLEEGCASRFYMPNAHALEQDSMAIYQRMGLTSTAIRQIATARPQRDVYYYCRETGQRLFHLPLDPMMLACVARNRAEDHDLMDRLLVQDGPEGFAAAWFRAHNFLEEATYVETFGREHPVAARITADHPGRHGAVSCP
jgi:type IV secretion system protein VirB4